MAEAIHWSFRFLYVVVAALALGWLGTGIRSIPPGEQAVVLRMGRVVRVHDEPGLVLAWPRPIDEIVVLPSKDRQLALSVSDFALRGDSSGRDKPGLAPRTDPAYLRTGDGGVLHADGAVLYSIADPVRFGLHVAEVKPALRRAFCAALVAEIARRTMEQLLITELDATRAAVRKRMQIRLGRAGLDLGLTVQRINLTVSLPRRAKAAFDEAQSALAEASRSVANAEKSARFRLQEANREAQSIRIGARGLRQEILTRARIETDGVAAVLAQAAGAGREEVLDRHYRVAMARILEVAERVVVLSAEDESRLILPAGEKR
jgi:regulator of protease activity HflC (stomatin/prohibitin superfamily)